MFTRRLRLLLALGGRRGWLHCAKRALSIFFAQGYLGLRRSWRGQAAAIESGLQAEPPLSIAEPTAPRPMTEKPNDDHDQAVSLISAFKFTPTFSLLLPLAEVEPHLLRQCLDSVRGQVYPHWELCAALGAAHLSENRRLLENMAGADARVKLALPAENAAASPNAALALAGGDYVFPLHPADLLPAGALFEFAQVLNQGPKYDLLYGDEDQVDLSGRRHSPWLKPGWSPETLEGYWYTGHAVCYRAEALQETGGFREEFGGSAAYDLVLRFTEKKRLIAHIGKILYHWRTLPGSNGLAYAPRDSSFGEARLALLERALRLGGEGGSAGFTPAPGCYDLRYAVKGRPLVSILIATAGRDGDFQGRPVNMVANLARQIHELTTWKNLEIIVAHNNDLAPEVEAGLLACGCQLLAYEGDFNYSKKINLAARAARGEYLLLLNDDLEIISPDWLENMLQLAQRAGVGAVGAKLWFPDGRVQHIGVFFSRKPLYKNFDYLPGHIFHSYRPEHVPPPLWNANHNYLTVTGAALMTPRELFLALGGFNEQLKITANDVDYCLRAIQAGRRVVWAARTALYHYESFSRDKTIHDEAEIRLLWETWRDFAAADPYSGYFNE